MNEQNKYYRSLLFTPGNSWEKIVKSTTLNADAVVLDLEDSVPLNKKDEAREIVSKALSELKWNGDIGVRINGLDTEYWTLDLHTVASSKPDFIIIPKVKSSIDIITVSKTLNSLLKYYRVSKNIKIHITIEDSKGLLNLNEIVRNSYGLIDAISFGRVDFIADTGCQDSPDILLIPRLLVAIAASSINAQAIDTVYINYKDMEGLEKDAKLAKALGYTGKAAIHPGQIDIINKIFTPSKDEIEYAKKVINVYEDAIKKGIGAISLENKMIDEAVVKSAKKILSLAKNLKDLTI